MIDDVKWLKFWREVNVYEKCEIDGCIPASLHWLLVWNQLTGNIKFDINYDDFQEKIGNKILPGNRDFNTVSKFIIDEYKLPSDLFQKEEFKTGKEKIDQKTIEKLFKPVFDF